MFRPQWQSVYPTLRLTCANYVKHTGSRLVQVEINLDIDQNGYWDSILAARFKLPESNCFDGFLIKTHA